MPDVIRAWHNKSYNYSSGIGAYLVAAVKRSCHTVVEPKEIACFMDRSNISKPPHKNPDYGSVRCALVSSFCCPFANLFEAMCPCPPPSCSCLDS